MSYPPSQPPPDQWAAPTVCARHPDRPTGLRCARCERPACPQCLQEAAVGYQCIDCVNAGRRSQRRATTVAGAEFGGTPVVVPTLIAVNAAIFAITAAQAGGIATNTSAELFQHWALWPPAVAFGQWWRLLTSGFLHIGPIHLAFNMIALWVIGRDLETVLGRGRFVGVYLVSLLGGSAAVFLFGDPERGVAGASGAVFGLMGGLAVMLLRLRLPLGPAITVIALNVVISFLPGISLLGHLGGLVVGAAATAALVYAPRQGRTAWQAGALLGLAVLLVVLIVGRYAQFGEVVCYTAAELVCQVRG